MKSKVRGSTGVEELIVLVAILVLVLPIAAWLASYKCSAQWSESGLQSKWQLGSGCRVKTPDGRWLPADRVRETEIAPKESK